MSKSEMILASTKGCRHFVGERRGLGRGGAAGIIRIRDLVARHQPKTRADRPAVPDIRRIIIAPPSLAVGRPRNRQGVRGFRQAIGAECDRDRGRQRLGLVEAVLRGQQRVGGQEPVERDGFARADLDDADIGHIRALALWSRCRRQSSRRCRRGRRDRQNSLVACSIRLLPIVALIVPFEITNIEFPTVTVIGRLLAPPDIWMPVRLR